MNDDLLYRRYKDSSGKRWLQLIVLVTCREEILHELHSGVVSGYLGEDKTLG